MKDDMLLMKWLAWFGSFEWIFLLGFLANWLVMGNFRSLQRATFVMYHGVPIINIRTIE